MFLVSAPCEEARACWALRFFGGSMFSRMLCVHAPIVSFQVRFGIHAGVSTHANRRNLHRS